MNNKIQYYIDENCEKVKCCDCGKTENLYKDQRCVGDVYYCINCLEQSLEEDIESLEGEE